MKRLALFVPALLLAACDPFGLPENPPETAAYYVATGAANDVAATRVAIAYETPDGPARDTLLAPSGGVLTSWSRVFERDALPAFSITAENLTPADTAGQRGFVSVSLLVNDETVAFDTSAAAVSLSN